MKTIYMIVLVVAAVLGAAVVALADDCGGYRCPPPEYMTPVPTPVLVPSTPTPLPQLRLPLVIK